MESSGPIKRHFESLEDPRVVGRTDHPLLTVVLMAVVAVIGGAEGWEEIGDFAEDRKDWFARFLDMPHGVPSESTFYRVFRALDPQAFAACMRAWVGSLTEALAGQVVAFDGKTLRGGGARGARRATSSTWSTSGHASSGCCWLSRRSRARPRRSPGCATCWPCWTSRGRS